MRVLQVAWEHPPRLFGGLGRHVEGLSAALGAHGCGVTVLTPECSGPERPAPGVEVVRAAAPAEPLPPTEWIAAALDANVAMVDAALTAGVDADVLHVHDWMVGHAARLLARLLEVPVVATVHATERGRHMGHLPDGPSRWIDAQEQALVRLAAEVVVCARHMADQVAGELGADPDRIHVVPNGVDALRWRRPPAPTGRLPRVVVAGRLEFEKGIHVLLDATDGLPCEVVVAGEGTFAAELQRRAHRRVRFTGRLEQPALAALIRSATVVAVPSLYEPFGLAALEAMAAGTPVVASDTGGLSEVCADRAGRLVPAGDARALRTALVDLLADDAQRDRLVRSGTARAVALTWDATAAAHLDLYRSLLDR